jgi:hypothetical protein
VIQKLGSGKVSKKAGYHFRLAPEEVAIKLSGFRVSPMCVCLSLSLSLSMCISVCLYVYIYDLFHKTYFDILYILSSLFLLKQRKTTTKHNAVSPFGILEPQSIALVASSAIFESDSSPPSGQVPSFIWMGGGHPDLKLGCSTHHFIKALNPIVADISEPR